jgi:hypothetical protein
MQLVPLRRGWKAIDLHDKKLVFLKTPRASHDYMPSTMVGRCTLTPPDPQLKGAWFQTHTFEHQSWWFQNACLSNATCAATP